MKATLALRQAVRPWIAQAEARVAIGVSGGADSLALAAAVALEAQPQNIEVIAVVVDHGLQESSDQVALTAKSQLEQLGISHVIIKRVQVERVDGIEASARRARYAAFEEVIKEHQPDYFFLAHTLNDQAESVLLGLARGSGSKSLAGMQEVNGIYVRPLLGIERTTTEAACAEQKIDAWQDPHNEDSSYTRVRVRKEILPLMEKLLGPGIIAALGRTAALVRQDAQALDGYAQAFLARSNPSLFSVEELADLPAAVRARVLREAFFRAGAPEGSLSAAHLAPVEALITDWHGQGLISLPGGVKVERISGRLSFLNQPGGRAPQ